MNRSSEEYWPDSLPEGPAAGCAVVMAHPDDEVLWASSVLAQAGKVILCFGDAPGKPFFSDGRRRAVAQLPLPGLEALQISEAAVAGTALWPQPEEVAEGLAPRRLPLGLEAPLRRAYRRNFETLCHELTARLAGVREVVTHNPWGEYGHEEHVQVFRAVQAVSATLGFRIWVSGYMGERAVGLMQRHLDGLGQPSRPRPVDVALGHRLRDIYIGNACWSWPDDYTWPEVEWFYPVLSGGEAGAGGNVAGAKLPVHPARINMIQTGWIPDTGGRHMVRCLARSLRIRAVTRLPVLAARLERMDHARAMRRAGR